jgi:hypothetical protein
MKFRRGQRARPRRATAGQWITTPKLWQQIFNLVASPIQLDLFSSQPQQVPAEQTGTSSTVNEWDVTGWIEVDGLPAPSVNVNEIGCIAVGLYVAQWNGPPTGGAWQVQTTLYGADVNRDNWLYLRSKGIATSSQALTASPNFVNPVRFNIRIPKTRIGQGEGLFLTINSWDSVTGTSM